MITFGFVKGFCLGIEYTTDEDLGFIVCLDLGVLRVVWYKDIEADE